MHCNINEGGRAGICARDAAAVCAASVASCGNKLAKMAFGLIVAVLTIFVALNLLDWLTAGISEMDELKKGNVAVAILVAVVLLWVTSIVEAGTRGVGASAQIESCAIAAQVSDVIGWEMGACIPYAGR